MGIVEIILLTIACGVATLQIDKALDPPAKPPFKSEAPEDGSFYFKPDIKINGKRVDV
jgi:hypothetical protein